MSKRKDKAYCEVTALTRGPTYYAHWCRYHGIDPTPPVRRVCMNTARYYRRAKTNRRTT